VSNDGGGRHRMPPMTGARSWLKLTVPAGLLAASLIVGLASSTTAPHQQRSAKSSAVAAHENPPPRPRPGPTHPHRRPRNPTASRPQLPSARTVALEFAYSWLGCLYHHASCSQIRGILASYARFVQPQLASGPVTHGDLHARPRIISLRLTHNCRLEAVATVTYTVGGQVLDLHPNLVLQPAGWKVFTVAEFPAPIPLPPPLQTGERLC